ncbi:MAG: DUF6465 family protein [Ruminococcus flavefaciens]|nr:DUF6465 family protein [Ruminococcus flavefaciens]
MARPRKNAPKTTKSSRGRKSNAAKAAAVETPVVAEAVVENPVIIEEETIAETSVDVAVEEAIEELMNAGKKSMEEDAKAEEKSAEVPAEPKPKRKYTRRAKKEETPVVAEEAPAEKKTTRTSKKASTPEVNAYIQGAGAEKSFSELAEKAKALSGVKSPKSVNLYIKPYEEDGVAKVYYVVDNIAGHFSLF